MKLVPFQHKGIKRLLDLNGRALLADEMGLGKTIQSLWYLKLSPEVRPVLIICPATAKWHWQDEAQDHLRMPSIILSGQTPTRQGLLKDKTKIIIINYDILESWERYLKHKKFKCIILDECHYIKNLTAQRTQAVQRITKGVPHVICLSGTPLTNRPSELFSTLHLISPRGFPSYANYAFQYCNRKFRYGKFDDRGARNLDRLHRLLKSTIMIRRTKEQVLKELPKKSRSVIPLDIEDRKRYETEEQDCISFLSRHTKAKDRKTKSEGLVKLGKLKRLAAELKFKAVCHWVDNVLEETDEKIVLFGIHKKLVRALYERYKSQAVLVYGPVQGKKRREAIKRFQNDSKIRVFVGNLIAAGTVITLTAARYAAMFEIDWVPGNHMQAEDRIHRITQTLKVHIYYLVAKGTIEEKLCEMLQRKSKVITQTLDGKSPTATKFTIYDELKQSMLASGQILAA